MKVSELISESLQSYGVKRIYGLIGTSILEIIDSLKDKNIQYVSTRHEYGALAMADGEARTTGFPGVALVHAGPGFLNSLTGIANSYKDSSPLLVISGAVKRRLAGTDSWLEVNQMEIVKHITKKSFHLSNQLEAPSTVSRAFSYCFSKPQGPVLLEVPEDVLKSEVHGSVVQYKLEAPPEPSENEIDKVMSFLNSSERPLILAGGGINSKDGSVELSDLVNRTRIPVVTTGNGRGVISEEEELCLGRAGFGGGNIVADTAFRNADLVIAIGAGISDITTYGYNISTSGRIVAVDLNQLSQIKPVAYTIHIEADAVTFVRKLKERIGTFKQRSGWLESIRENSRRLKAQLKKYLETRKNGFVNPGLFLAKLDESSRDYILSLGQGFHTLYGYVFMKVRRPRSFLAATNMGSMGFAFPASLGAKMANKDRNVICVIGDGEFLMSMAELETAVRERIGVRLVILNDNSYRVLLMRQIIQKMGRIYGTLHTNPEITKIADAFSFEAVSIDSNERIEEGISFLKEKTERIKVVELKVDREDVPPFNVDSSLLF